MSGPWTPGYRPATFLKAALIRVCHPLPSFLKWAITSGSRRIEICFLRFSSGSFGRPRATLANQASSSSSASPSSSIYDFSVSFLLILICLSQGNDPDRIAKPAPDTDVEPFLDKPNRGKPHFAMVAANIRSCKGRIPIKECHVGEIDTAVQQGSLPLVLVPFIDVFANLIHRINIYIKNIRSNHVSVFGKCGCQRLRGALP